MRLTWRSDAPNQRNGHMNRFNHPSAQNTGPEQTPEESRSISLKKALAIGAVPLLLLFVTAFQSSNFQRGGIGEKAEENVSRAAKEARKFYLTKNLHDGAHALTACVPGYHMASRWEINDPTYLRYDTELGFTTADSGFGPPSTFIGWIRTGRFNDVGASTGSGNCNAWMSADVADSGTWLVLPFQWDLPGIHGSPWKSGTTPCNNTNLVWCVQD